MYTPNRIEWCTVFLFYILCIRSVRLTWMNARMQAVLGAYVGKQGLDRHLDADEAVSLGAALQAANLSDGFKLNRKIGMVDGSTYGIVIGMDGATLESEDQKLLVPRMKKLPSKVSTLTPGVPNALQQSWQV
jgi:molecular chaperone DnaK (HSP70)